jgi:transglutaminase-like putative cysteine protease
VPGLRARDDRRLPGARHPGALCQRPDPDSGGAGESHAWVDVHVGESGWLSLDPTHDAEQTDRYVRVGVGRDYGDVPPSRGVYRGSADETLEVAVTIREP